MSLGRRRVPHKLSSAPRTPRSPVDERCVVERRAQIADAPEARDAQSAAAAPRSIMRVRDVGGEVSQSGLVEAASGLTVCWFMPAINSLLFEHK